MSTLTMQFNAGVLRQSSASWRVRGRSAHVGATRSEDSGACSTLAALVALEMVSGSEAARLAHELDCDRAGLWSDLRDALEIGSLGRDLHVHMKAIAPAARTTMCQGSMREILTFTGRRIRTGGVVLLCTRQGYATDMHWTLAVGVEQLDDGRRRRDSALLCLDSIEVPPACAPFNARLDLLSPNEGARFAHYRLPGGRVRLVTCTSAIALSKAPPQRGGRHDR